MAGVNSGYVAKKDKMKARFDKHLHLTRKLVVEGGLVQKRLYDIGWSDEKKCKRNHGVPPLD